MIELIQENWPFFVIALLVGIAVAWLVFVGNRKTKVETDTSDVLDEGRGPAARNQALIDAAPAAGAGGQLRRTSEKTPASVAETAATAPTSKDAASSAPSQTQGQGLGQDDLTRIKGVGPKLVAILADLGITKFTEIAAWNESDIDRIDAQLGRFEGRIRRDNWVEQAKLLAAEDMATYQEKFGKL